jgi:hypothetical protein
MNELIKALEHEGSALSLMAKAEIIRLRELCKAESEDKHRQIALKNAALDAIVHMVDGK